jgi:3-phenylpropionate/cinnamic acid dioxygenase small subunit
MDERLQQLIDRQEIIDQMYAYTRWVDLNRPDEQVKVFVEDCRVNFARGDDHWMQGRDAMLAFVTNALTPYTATNHTISNIEITFEGPDTARAQSYVQAWHRWADGRPDFLAYGRYHDVWIRTPEGWRMSERRFKVNAGIGRSTEGNEPAGRAG